MTTEIRGSDIGKSHRSEDLLKSLNVGVLAQGALITTFSDHSPFLIIREVILYFFGQFVDSIKADYFLSWLVIAFEIVGFGCHQESATAGHFEIPALDLVGICR